MRHGKAMRGSPAKQRTVLTVFDWAAEAFADWAERALPRYGRPVNDLFPTRRAGWYRSATCGSACAPSSTNSGSRPGWTPPDTRTWGSRRTSTTRATLCGGRGRLGAPARAATGRRAAGARDPKPRVWTGFEAGRVGLPQGCLAPSPRSVWIHRYAARPDARGDPTAARGWACATAAARIYVADCPGVQRPAGGAAD